MLKINVRGGKRYTFAAHINDMLLPREKAESIEAFLVIIKPGEYTHPHFHADNEQLYYVILGRGKGIFTEKDGTRREVELLPEDVIFVPRFTEHQIFCTSKDEPLNYLCVDGFPESKPKGEPTWDDHYREVLAEQNRKGMTMR